MQVGEDVQVFAIKFDNHGRFLRLIGEIVAFNASKHICCIGQVARIGGSAHHLNACYNRA